jgi:hypothetical protein
MGGSVSDFSVDVSFTVRFLSIDVMSLAVQPSGVKHESNCAISASLNLPVVPAASR